MDHLYVNKLSSNQNAHFYLNGCINGSVQTDYVSYGYYITNGYYPDGVTKTQIYYLNANDTFHFWCLQTQHIPLLVRFNYGR